MPFGEPWTLILVSISVVISGLMCVKEIIQWLRGRPKARRSRAQSANRP